MRYLSAIRRDLRVQLLASYLLLIAPILLAATIFTRLSSQRLEADVKAADLALARAIAQETNTTLENALQTVRQLANYPAVLEADEAGMETLFNVLLNTRSDINLIYRLDADGIMLYHYPTGPLSTLGVDFSFRDYFKKALTTQNPLISKGRISPTTRQAVATAVMPLWGGEEYFLGLVGTNIKLQFLSNTLAKIAAEHRSEEGFNVMIIDHAGYVVAHPDPDMLLNDMTELPEITNAVLSGKSGTLILGDQAEEILYSYVPVPIAGWGVIVSRPTSAAFATQRVLTHGVWLTIIVFLAVGVIFWLFLSRRVINPLEIVARYSQSIGEKTGGSEEDRHSLELLSQRNDQMGHLALSLQRMEAAINARIQELSTLLRTSATVVSSLDTTVVLGRILEQVEHLMDAQICAIVAYDEQRRAFRIQASRGLSTQYAERLRIDPHEHRSVSLRAIRTGEPIQVSDVETDPTFQPFLPRARAEGYRSLIAVPLNTQHAPPSALLVYRPEPHNFSHREINLLTNFANHAAMAIENATLYARSDMRLQEQTRRLEALIHSMRDGLTLEDMHGKVLYANRRISQITGVDLQELHGVTAHQLIQLILSKALNPEEAQEAIQAIMSGDGKRYAEIILPSRRGRRYLRLQSFNVTDAQGVLLGRGQIWQDITADKELDRMKSNLISTVSHELRTPLASIKGYVTTLLADDVTWDPEAQQEFLNIISTETDRLSQLVDDLLDLSRIEAGMLKVNRHKCRLNELVQEVIARVISQPNARVHMDIPDDLPLIHVDPQRIEVVLRNLIENAVKYSSEEDPIFIRARSITDHIEVRVEDSGPGIPPEHWQRIFDSFYRVESGLTRTADGAGLGLAICQGIILAHDGEIWLVPRDQGTCIAFTLPIIREVEPVS